MEGRKLFALNAAIEGLYTSAADGTPWDAKQVRSLLGTDFCHVLCMNEAGTIINASSSDLSEESQRQYLEYWAQHDDFGPALFAHQAGRAFTDEALIARRTFESMPVFEGFYEPHGMVHFSVGYHAATNGLFVGISAQNTRETGRISTETLQYINLLNQHLRRAFQINQDVTALLSQAHAEDHLLFQWGLGLLRCDTFGRVYGMYGQAEALLTQFRALLRVTGGSLRLLDAGGHRRLRSLLRDPAHGAPYAGPTIALRDAENAIALELTVLDIQSAHNVSTPGGRLILMRESGRPGKVDRHYLRRRLDITPAEADVLAQLMLGTSVPAIADSRGSTLETVRSYLKTLRKKLNCTSQVELVSLGWSTIGFQPSGVRRATP